MNEFEVRLGFRLICYKLKTYWGIGNQSLQHIHAGSESLRGENCQGLRSLRIIKVEALRAASIWEINQEHRCIKFEELKEEQTNF